MGIKEEVENRLHKSAYWSDAESAEHEWRRRYELDRSDECSRETYWILKGCEF